MSHDCIQLSFMSITVVGRMCTTVIALVCVLVMISLIKQVLCTNTISEKCTVLQSKRVDFFLNLHAKLFSPI